MRILILKTSALGDIVHVFDTLAYIREVCPFAQIEWMVEEECASLVRAHPLVDHVYEVKTRKWRQQFWGTGRERRDFFAQLPKFWVIFDFQGNCKSALLLRRLKGFVKVGFGRRFVSEWPNVLFTNRRYTPPTGKNVREDYLYLAQAFFKDFRPYRPPSLELRLTKEEQLVVDTIPRGVTVVCPFAAWPNKQISRRLLLEILAQEVAPFYFTWADRQQLEYVQSLVAVLPHAYVLPKCSLPMLQRVMAHAGKVIAMDSLPLHLCGTTQTPTLSFFGPSLATKFAPIGEQHHFLQGNCPYGEVFERRCRYLRTCQSAACIFKK